MVEVCCTCGQLHCAAMTQNRIPTMKLSGVYAHYVAKAEAKGKAMEEILR